MFQSTKISGNSKSAIKNQHLKIKFKNHSSIFSKFSVRNIVPRDRYRLAIWVILSVTRWGHSPYKMGNIFPYKMNKFLSVLLTEMKNWPGLPRTLWGGPPARFFFRLESVAWAQHKKEICSTYSGIASIDASVSPFRSSGRWTMT